MKSQYEMLNDVEMNVEQYEEQNLSELERKRMKQMLRKEIEKNQKNKKGVSNGVKVAGISLLLVGSFSMVGVMNPAIAQGVPVIHQVFESIHQSLFADTNYENYSEQVSLVSQANGVTIEIDEIACDNNKLVYSYTIQSDQVLQDPDGMSANVWTHEEQYFANGEEIKWDAINGSGEFIDSRTYRGITTIQFRKVLPEQFGLEIKFGSISANGVETEGPFTFKTPVEMKTSSESVVIDTQETKSINHDIDVKATVNNIVFSPLETSVQITVEGDGRMGGKDIQWSMIDSNGNRYLVQEWKGVGGLVEDAEDVKTLRSSELYYSFSPVDEVPEWVSLIPSIEDFGDEPQWLEEYAIKVNVQK